MSSTRKRTSKKLGEYGRRTVTTNPKRGRTISISSKPPGSNIRRTTSYHDGKVRTTYSRNSNGWTHVSSKTITTLRKPKKSKSSAFWNDKFDNGKLGGAQYSFLFLVFLSFASFYIPTNYQDIAHSVLGFLLICWFFYNMFWMSILVTIAAFFIIYQLYAK